MPLNLSIIVPLYLLNHLTLCTSTALPGMKPWIASKKFSVQNEQLGSSYAIAYLKYKACLKHGLYFDKRSAIVVLNRLSVDLCDRGREIQNRFQSVFSALAKRDRIPATWYLK